MVPSRATLLAAQRPTQEMNIEGTRIRIFAPESMSDAARKERHREVVRIVSLHYQQVLESRSKSD
ncbi:hypothetical protein NZD89_21595 [Alicyclobacillus fastidiosus]|uniref:Uncharacterized protein n=1 Tax=Alicyclobacillus fastidiosus TaxID=392011 RepID=A0ABY6ZFF4_9BACL|nr:hypothetical protein [Alicyclobacillus fastidiosus]WAH40859.1 hypothetical protein NZD89_21595 [Alicyclobacillus fastidiosus]GMA62347.1 hypothetical protein GCM10025859_27870 [Alicyclobacillus fastidiosus]